MKTLTIALALTAGTTAAFAAPELIWEAESLGDGWTGYTFSVSDDNYASWAVNITFFGMWGAIAQQQAFGALDVTWEAEANTYTNIPSSGYDKAFDSWVFDDWTALATGVSRLPGEAFHIHAGTPGGVAQGTLPLAYLACNGSIGWNGTIARLGVDYLTASGRPSYEMYPHGPYEIGVGEELVLDASGSQLSGNEIDLYEWDLNDDGDYETSAGGDALLTVPYDYLESLGLGVGGSYVIGLRGTVDGFPSSYPESTRLTIVPEPAGVVLLISGFSILERRRRNARLRRSV